jgi:hypothetical protein
LPQVSHHLIYTLYIISVSLSTSRRPGYDEKLLP